MFFGKYRIFVIGTVLASIMVAVYCNLDVTPIWVIIMINVLMFTGITARMISSSALLTAIPEPQDRGAFMGINSSVQQIAGGVASAIAGVIVIQSPSGKLERYPLLGYVVIGSMIVTVILMYFLNQYVSQKALTKKADDIVLPHRDNGQEIIAGVEIN